jgi:flagellar biosynthesis protein FlhG
MTLFRWSGRNGGNERDAGVLILSAGQEAKKTVKTIAVASGKGGVGKTNVVANLAVAMRRQGKNVLIVDADLGLSNIDVLLHLAPRHTIQHVLNGDRSLKDVIIDGPQGIKILPAGSGIQELTDLDELQRLKILEEFDAYDGDIDVLLIDTAAGLSENVSFFCTAAQEIVIVTSPEPTAITGASALIRVLFTRYQEKQFHVLVNSAGSVAECVEVFKRLSQAAEEFQNISLNYLGCIPFDESVHLAVREQKAFVDLYPGAPASRQVADIAARLGEHSGSRVKGSLQFFIGNLVSAATHSSG